MFDRLTSPDGPKLNLPQEPITVISPSIPLADSSGDPPLERLGFRRAFGLKLGIESGDELVW